MSILARLSNWVNPKIAEYDSKAEAQYGELLDSLDEKVRTGELSLRECFHIMDSADSMLYDKQWFSERGRLNFYPDPQTRDYLDATYDAYCFHIFDKYCALVSLVRTFSPEKVGNDVTPVGMIITDYQVLILLSKS